MVSSTVPRPAAKCPPRVLTLWMRNARSSAASAGSLPAARRRRSAGLAIASSSGYLSGGALIVPSVYTRVPARSALAADDETGELGERAGACPEGLESGYRRIAQLPRPRPRGVDSGGARVSRLGVRGVGAGRLAEQCGVPLDIE